MKKHYSLLDIRLSLFDGGAAGAGAAAPAGGAPDTGTQAETEAIPGSSRRGKKAGGLGSVVYGKQPDAIQEENPDAGDKQTAETVGTKEEKLARFRELVGGEFKDEYTADTQRIIDRRFKQVKGLEEEITSHKPIMDMLLQRYQIADGNLEKLTTAIEQDNAYWAQAAEEAGMDVEQYKQFQKLQRENEAFRQMQKQRQGQEAAQQRYAAWMQEADQVKAVYPDFNMETECQNRQFLSMLQSGVPVLHAYEVTHLDDIKGGLARQTAAQTEKKVVDGIRAKGARPAENGVSSNSGITFKSDVSKLTALDRREIARRAARGETIRF